MHFNGIYISSKMKSSLDHSHPYCELCMNLEGKAINKYNGTETAVDVGTVFLCPAEGVHSKSAVSGMFKDIFIGFDDDGYFEDISEFYFEDCNNIFYNLFMIMYDIFHSDLSEKNAILNNLLETICGIIKSRQVGAGQCTPVIERLKSEISANFSNPEYKISDFTGINNYSIDYLRQAFKKQTGVSPLEYLNDMRINNAKKLLVINRTPTYRINEVAQFSGFYDVGYFTRMFKKKTGMTPTEYRESKLNPPKEEYTCIKQGM